MNCSRAGSVPPSDATNLTTGPTTLKVIVHLVEQQYIYGGGGILWIGAQTIAFDGSLAVTRPRIVEDLVVLAQNETGGRYAFRLFLFQVPRYIAMYPKCY